MKTTEELKSEHEGIKLMLEILEAAAKRLGGGEPVSADDLDGMVEFLTVFADRCHHGKEEEFLFPALESAGLPREGGPIAVMLSEHDRGRALIGKLREALGQLKSGDKAASERFQEAAAEYAALLRQHIHKENNILFPMADAALDPAKDDALAASFEKLERDRIGPGRHEAFHALLDRLKGEYLGPGPSK